MATEKISATQSRQRLGEILLRTTSLTEAQLKEALEIQAKEGGVLGEILLRKNFVMPHEILKALCAQLDLPFVEDLKSNDIDAELVKNIPINYAKSIVDNARTLASTLADAGLAIVSGGTDTHLMLVDLRPKGLTGKVAEAALERANITCNKNGIPFDPEKPTITSGVRLGTPAGTTRGFGVAEFAQIGKLITEVLDGLAKNGDEKNGDVEAAVRTRVVELCRCFPIYGGPK